jgi:hypothetical protein
MEYVKIPAPAGLEDVFPDGIEVRKDLYDSGDQEAINQAIIGLGGEVIPMSAMNRRLQFAKGFTDTGRGLAEAAGIIEQDQSQEMRDRMIREGDLGAQAAYLAGAVAEFIPATAIKAITLPFKAVQSPVLRTALEFGAIGTAIGASQPVYEQLGDDRIRNAMTAGGLGVGLGGAVGKLMTMLGAKTEAEFLSKWEQATPEQRLELEQMVDEAIPLESREAQMARKSSENAAAAEADLAKQAEVEAIKKQGDIAEAARKDAEFGAQVEKDFAANLAEQRRLTDNMNMRDVIDEANAARMDEYNKALAEIGTGLKSDRLKELETTMKSIIAPKKPEEYANQIKSLKAKVNYWQKQLEELVAGKRKTGTGGRTGTQVREERLRAKQDLETLQTIQKRAAERESAVKEYVQLKYHGKSDVVDQRMAEAAAKLDKPVMNEAPQIPPRQPEPAPEAAAPLDLQIPQQLRRNVNTPRNAAGTVESVGGIRQKAVNRQEYEAQQKAQQQAQAAQQQAYNQAQQARFGGTGNVPPAGGATPQGATNVPPQGAQAASGKQGKFAEGLDQFFGSVSTRLGNISQDILGRARRLEFNISTKNGEHIARIEPFLKHLSQRIPTHMREDVAMKLFNGEHAAVMKMLPPEMRKEFYEVKKVLEEFKDEFKDLGIDFHYIPNYFPRRVKDLDGLLEHLGKQKAGLFDEALNVYAKKNGIDNVNKIPEDIRTDILDQVIRGVFRKGDTAIMPNAKQRTISRITDPELLKYYDDPATSLSYYIQNSRNAIEKAKFFGRTGVSKTSTGAVDTEKSIGHLIAKIAATGNLTPQQQRQLHSMLRSRFTQGEQAPNKFFSTGRDLGYMGTIGNPISALTQLGDIGVSLYRNGIAETIGSLFGKRDYTAMEMGIEHTIAHELQNERLTSKALNKLFTATGFRAVDNIGKSTLMTAAIKKNQKLVKTKAGEAKFRERWQGIFGDDIDSVITDLKMGNKTENTKFLAFNELSDVQPISLLEMPQKYLDAPNGRVLYMLKSFTLKQIDLVRRDIVQEAAKGNVGTATKNAFLLASFLAAAGVPVGIVKDWLRGRDVDMSVEGLTDRAMWSVLGVFGMNQYVTDRYLARGDIMGALQNMATPAAPLVDAAGQTVKQLTKDEQADWSKVINEVPSIKSTKQILDNFWLGGDEN